MKFFTSFFVTLIIIGLPVVTFGGDIKASHDINYPAG